MKLKWGKIGRTVLSIAAVQLALVVGWFEANALFHFTGDPPGLLSYLIAVTFTIITAGGLISIVARLRGQDRDGRVVFADMLVALDRISQGDFDVRLAADGRGPYAEVIESVNAMAGQLGTLEQQRQDFVSNVSHEIHSPLTSISGFAGLLRNPDLDEATRSHYLDIISAECKRLSGLSDNLLRLSALDDTVLNPIEFRLDEQVRDVILAQEPQWSAQQITVELDASPTLTEGDPDLLRQVWVNLFTNAVKFTPEGGRLRLRVKSNTSGSPTVEVSDTGIGISATDLPHIFERFYRADKARGAGGNGLGLALVKRIVELHGGHISVTSSVGQGTTFVVQLS